MCRLCFRTFKTLVRVFMQQFGVQLDVDWTPIICKDVKPQCCIIFAWISQPRANEKIEFSLTTGIGECLRGLLTNKPWMTDNNFAPAVSNLSKVFFHTKKTSISLHTTLPLQVFGLSKDSAQLPVFRVIHNDNTYTCCFFCETRSAIILIYMIHVFVPEKIPCTQPAASKWPDLQSLEYKPVLNFELQI